MCLICKIENAGFNLTAVNRADINEIYVRKQRRLTSCVAGDEYHLSFTYSISIKVQGSQRGRIKGIY